MNEKKQLTRNEIRGKIFSNVKRKSEIIMLFGAEVELRQPTIGEVLKLPEDDKDEAIIETLLTYCYVPGTDEKVFDEADRDGLKKQPFGPDIERVNKAMKKLTGIDILGEEKNSESTPSEGQSS